MNGTPDPDPGAVPAAPPPVLPPPAPASEARKGSADPARTRKFRQAAIVYLHVGLLYEAAVFVFWRQGILPEARGPAWLWLLIGAGIVAVVVWGLWSWRNAWFARAIWALHALRLPWLLEGAFFGSAHTGVHPALVPPSFYLTALFVVLVNLWMLARAGWDL